MILVSVNLYAKPREEMHFLLIFDVYLFDGYTKWPDYYYRIQLSIDNIEKIIKK